MYTPIQVTNSEWDQFVSNHPRGHLLQLSAWGKLKSNFGWYPVRVALADSSGKICAGGQLLLRRLPFMLGTLGYLPYAPLVDWSNEAMVSATLEAIQKTAKQHRAIFLKIEPGYDIPTHLLKGFSQSNQTVQPPSTVILDLDNEEAILKRMNQMTRRNIRKSEKQEITIREGTRADVDKFNAMLNETGNRQEF